MLSKEDILRRHAMWEETMRDVHAFFGERGFLHVHTPLMVKSPGMEPNLDPFEVTLRTTHPMHEQKAGLITSPEYSMKKLLGAGLEKIYTITPVFRNVESLGQHNAPEFTMLEWYEPGNDQDGIRVTGELLSHVLQEKIDWPVIDYANAAYDACEDPHIAEKRFFVQKFPSEKASLARLSEDGTYAMRFEAYADGLELCNGFAELTDSQEQRRRFEEEQKQRESVGKTVFPIDEDLLNALDTIQQPMYGNALGLDRLVMLRYGIRDINDIHIFPPRDMFGGSLEKS